jgi:glycerol-3-phosphate dehydrogenase subunit B
MRHSFDVVVIGGGIAGVAAALAAAHSGARVALVRATPGATAITSGAWHGALPAPLADALAAAGLPHRACDAPLLHPCGDARRSAYAAASHVGAIASGDTLVCGIAGLGGFHAPALARLWTAGAAEPLRSATLSIDGTPPAGWSPVSLAAALERDVAPLAVALAAAVRAGGGIVRAILPAVLGFDGAARVLATLRDAAAVEVAEALGAPPSVPGWRLDRALGRALARAGVDVFDGRAQRGEDGSGARVAGSLHVRRAGSDGERAAVELAARCFVLATGKFAAGGIAADARFHEPALGCPVWIEHVGRRFDAPHPLALTVAERSSAQPLLAAGVHADDAGRPVDAFGDVVFEDVIVAGSVRAGVTTAELGLGAAAEDGWRAGELAARAMA